MWRVRPWLAVCVLFPLSISTSAQQPVTTAQASDPQGIALLQRALSALVGTTTVSDVTLAGTARRIAGSDDETGTAVVMATELGDSKVALAFPSGNRTEIRNHSALPLPGSLPSVPYLPAFVTQALQPVGAWSDSDGAMHGMASHNIMTDPTWFFPALTIANIVGSKNYVVSYIGPETLSVATGLNGELVIHIAASRLLMPQSAPSEQVGGPQPLLGVSILALMQRLGRMDIYFDPSTSLPVGLAFNVHPDGNALVDLAVWIQFSNYQATGGVQIPMEVQKFVNGSLVLDFQFTNATLNSGLTADSFQLQ